MKAKTMGPRVPESMAKNKPSGPTPDMNEPMSVVPNIPTGMSDAPKMAGDRADRLAIMESLNRAQSPAPAMPARRVPTPPMRGRMAFAQGGSASSRADGCAKRGKTKGTIV